MHRNKKTIVPLRLLLLEDNTADADLLIAELRRAGVQAEVKVVGTRAGYVENLDPAFDAIISDFDLPQFNAKEALALLQARRLDIPFIVASGTMGEETAVELIKLGAADYLLKDRLGRLPQALLHAVDAAALRRERTVGEIALRVSEERMRSTIDSALDCIITIDQQSIILEFNPAAEQTFGYKREEVVGRDLNETIIPPHLREAHLRGMARLLQTGESRILGQHIEVTGMRADGSEFPLELAVSRLGTQDPPQFTAFLRDITEQKSGEEKLRRQEKQYRELFEENPSPMWVYDTKTLRILAANNAASVLYGYSREEFLEITLRDLRPTDAISKMAKAIGLDGGGPEQAGIWRHLRKDRSLLWAEVYSSAIVFERNPARMSIIIDVTARIEAEQKVRASEAGLAQAQRMAHFGSWEHGLTPDGERDQSTLRSSEEMYRIFGFERSFTHSHAAQFESALHPGDRARIQAVRAETFRTGEPYDIEHRIVRSDGIERMVHVRAELIRGNGNGKADRVLGTTQDVTERKTAEKALKAADEKYRTIFENASEGIFQTTPDGEIIVINPAAARILGFESAEEHLQKRPDVHQGYVDPQRRQQFKELIEKDGIVTGFESEVYRKDGSIICISENARLVRNAAGEAVCYEGTFEETTERRRVERELKLSESRLRAIIDNEPECVKTVSADGLLMEMNRAGLRMIEAESNAQVRGRPVCELIHPDDRVRFEELHRRASTGGTGHLQFRLLGLRGTERWVDTHSVGLPSGKDGPTSVLSVTRDITSQRRAEAATRESDQHLADIINSVEGIVWEAEQATGQVTFVSQKAEEILGYPTARWVSEPHFWQKHLHPEDREKTMARFADATAQGPPAELEYRMISAEGRTVWFKDRVTVVSLPDRSIKQRGIMLDVTHRKMANLEARAGEARIREQAKLLDLAHDAIMVRDMEDRIEFWNHGAEKLYGWTAAEVHLKEAAAFLRKTDPADAAAARAAVIENGKWTGECKHLCKDGGHVIVRSRWTLVRDDLGAPKSILIINTDITEQKRIEEQFLRAQRLESIGTLASGVAHDLNNILAPILMGAAVLRRTEMPAPDEMILSTIETCAQRGADIVKQVLTFARGTEGARLLLQPAHLINEMAKIAEGTFPKTITVRTEYLQSLWPIEGDPTQLHQILLNLSVNARDAMPAGGALTISARNFPVDEHYASMTPGAKAGPHVLFEVKDTGMGIPRQIIDQIFDPFFTTKELGRGTGLGLSTVIGIAKSHGGFVSVESEIGRGTTFKVYLPAMIDAPGGLKKSETAALPPAKGELLLIVDDEKLILQVAKELLEGHGYQVLTAEDAPEALAIFALRMDEIKLVLTDLAMPLMDGIALIRTLKKMKPDVCLIASTGQGSMEQGVHELVGLNVRACLTKPYNKEMLLTTLHDALNLETHKI
jgi:PAS domain S-box-containing protein